MTETRPTKRTPIEGGASPSRATRLPYTPPQLTPLGALRTATLGGSPGIGETANPETRAPLP